MPIALRPRRCVRTLRRLDEMGHRETEILVRLPGLLGQASHLRVGPNGHVEHVFEVDAVVTQHSA
jgi:hypothetical protein